MLYLSKAQNHSELSYWVVIPKSFVLGPRVAKPSMAFPSIDLTHFYSVHLLYRISMILVSFPISIHPPMHESLEMRHDSFRDHRLTHLYTPCSSLWGDVHCSAWWRYCFLFQIFYPTTTDLYDRKNMPRVIYCIHALRWGQEWRVHRLCQDDQLCSTISCCWEHWNIVLLSLMWSQNCQALGWPVSLLAGLCSVQKNNV